MLKEIVAIGIGGAIGSIARYGVVMLSTKVLGQNYTHYGTLAVNCIGSFFITLFMVLYIEKFDFDPIVRLIVVVGFLGGFTTFSSFSYETVAMLHGKQFQNALMYILATNGLGLFFAILGAFTAKTFINN